MHPLAHRFYTAAALILAIIPAVHADPTSVVKPVSITTRAVYPDGKPAADATVVFDLINYTTHLVTTHTYKPDQNGTVTITIDSTQLASNARCIYLTSPTGIGFWNYNTPSAISTSTLQPFTTVRIQLIDSTGKPIAHVKICPRDLTAERTSYGRWNDYIPGAWTQSTDGAGYATLTNLPQGFTLSLNILDNRYAAPDTKFDIKLADAASTPDATIQVDPSSSISGIVVYGPANKPVAGILVRAFSAGASVMAGPVLTDANGNYTLARLPAGTYNVTTMAGRGDFKEWIGQPQNVTIDTASHSSGNTLTIIHGGLISGKVTDKTSGTPISGIYVMVTPQAVDNRNTFASAVRTDTDGTYSLRMLPGTVTVVPSGQSGPFEGTVPQTVDIAEAENKTINFQVQAPNVPTAVHGVVLDPDGKPVSGAEVFAVSDKDQAHDIIADAQGQFTFDSPGLGPNTLIFARAGTLSSSLATAAPFPYTGGSSITLKLAAGALCTIKGQVKDQNGKPVPNSPATLYLVQGSRWSVIDESKTDATGQFDFPSSFANSKYTVEASPSGYVPNTSQPVEVTASRTVEVPAIVVALADSFVGGTVVDSRGKPIANVRITVSSIPDDTATTDQNGHFTIKGVPRDKLSVWVSSPDGGTASQDLTSGKSDNVITMAAAVIGVVLGPDNKPVSGAQVIVSSGGQGFQTTTTDSTGHFTFRTPGLKLKSTIVARSLTSDRGTASPSVYNGEDSINLNLTPGNLSPIRGQIKTTDGSPVPNAAVSLCLMDKNNGVQIDQTRTDAQGNYEFAPCFIHSRYILEVQAAGYGSTSSNISTTDAQHPLSAPTITVKPADSFAGGTVFDAKGSPAAGVTVNDEDVQDLQTTTDQAGHFLLHGVPRDKTDVYIQTSDGAFTSQSLASGRGDNVVYLKKPDGQK